MKNKKYQYFEGGIYEEMGRAKYYDTLPRGRYYKKGTITHVELLKSLLLFEFVEDSKLLVADKPIGSDKNKLLENLVLYRSIKDKKLLAMSRKSFFGKVELKGKEVLRFKLIKEEN